MEMYNVSEYGNTDVYMIQGTDSNLHLGSPPLEQFEAMYNKGAPEFVVEQGLYYPTATNYGYICTGLESPGNWDDHHRFLGLDGQEIFTGTQTDSFPYVYYTPSYGYAQSPYNPYNPYIPGAMVGVDAPFVGTQQYYTIPSYENPSSPAYFPMLVQTRPDIISNSVTEPFLTTSAFNSERADGPGLKQNLSSASTTFDPASARPVSNRAHTITRVSEGHKANAGSSKQPGTHGSVTSGSFSSMASSQVLRGRGAQAMDHISHIETSPHRNQLKVCLSSSNGLSDFSSSDHGQAMMEKTRTKFNYGRIPNDINGSPDAIAEQNRGPRTNKPKHHLAVKAYTTRAGDCDAQGNIIIYTGQYNKDDFPVDYVNAKFFVIKSYSEDDVHKSIKYNVWSSTPNGNKKLDSAYADAQTIAAGDPKGSPVFLFFSVNASGQFCGVAEMTGPVDFHKDMDFWQQDKWSGSFPLKWHIIRDVPNHNFRHIILENNENKPVTNSRDTQEIRYKLGIEMLKIFKNYASKTSLLDDFMYYENRQKIMQEEKARLLIKNYESPFFVPAVDPPRKLNCVVNLPSSEEEKIINTKHSDVSNLEKTLERASPIEQIPLDSDDINSNVDKENAKPIANEAKDDNVSSLKIGLLTINTRQDDSKSLETATAVMDTKPADVVTVGSVPVKVHGFTESTSFLRIGTIPLDPRALQLEEAGVFTKSGSKD